MDFWHLSISLAMFDFGQGIILLVCLSFMAYQPLVIILYQMLVT